MPALVIGLTLTGCGLLNSDPDYAGPPSPDLKLDKVWDSGSSRIEHASYAQVLDRTVIISEIPTDSDKRPGRTDQALIAVDAGTGERRWRVDRNTPPAPVLTRTGLTKAGPDFEYWYDPDSKGGAAKAALDPAGGLVALTYSQSSGDAPDPGYTDGWAVVGLNLTDGKPRWAYPAIPQLPADDPRARPDTKAKVIAVTGAAVMINLDATGSTGKPDTTIALDPRTGTELWRAEDILSFSAVGDSIIARSGAGTATVLDARTGKARWTSASPAYLSAVCDTHAVFLADDGDHQAVDLQTLAVTEFQATGRLVCDDGLLAWLTKRELRSRMINTEQTERGATELDPGSALHIKVQLEAAAGGYLWGTEWYELSPSEHPDPWVTFALDRTGAKRAELPGRQLLAVSGDYLIVSTGTKGDDGHPFEAYRIRPGQ